MVRSILLRGFDQQMAGIIKESMIEKGVKFLETSIPKSVEKCSDGKLLVTWLNTSDNSTHSDVFDTILFAIGRKALTKDLKLDNAGVLLEENSDKVATVNEQTNVSNIFAVGDVLYVSLKLY